MAQEKMENCRPLQEKRIQEPPRKKGGLKTMPFIIVNEVLEKVAGYGLLANMILYLKNEYNMASAKGASVLFIWSATSHFVPVFGSLLSDSYWGKYPVIALGSIISLLGMTLLWLTATIPGARPAACPTHQDCDAASGFQVGLLFASFAIMSLGAGGIRPCSMAFGADQFHHPDPKCKARILQTFFNWYYASVGVAVMTAVTIIVYIQDHAGWKVGLGVPAALMLVSATLFILGSPLYVKVKADKSLFTGLAQAVAAAVKNRRLLLPSSDARYHCNKGSTAVPSNTLGFLNKACVITNPATELNPDGSATDPWSLCTVQQVEGLKSILRLLPMWSTGIAVAVILNQHTFMVLQATTFNRHLGPSFEIPAGSISVFSLLTVTIWVIIYDRLVVPSLAKLTGNPRGITLRLRMAIGLLLLCVATAVSAMVEGVRRRRAIAQGFLENPYGVLDMPVAWLVPQQIILGLAEAFNLIGQIEFYYSELPNNMASIAMALFWVGLGVGNLVAALIVGIVNNLSALGGKEKWVSNNINKGHYNYYYWVLTVISGVNVFYFLLCSWAYGPCKEDALVLGKGGEEEEDVGRSGELSVILLATE